MVQTEAPCTDRAEQIAMLRVKMESHPQNKLRKDFKAPELMRGWLLPYLLDFDAITYGRWEYWFHCMTEGKLPPEPIPRMDFLSSPHKATRKMIEQSLDAIPNHGSWQTWGGNEYFRYFLEWVLFGFGHPGQPELPKETADCAGASDRLYQLVDVGRWMLYPHDYLGEILAEASYGKRAGFYPTPHTIVEMMCQMLMEGEDCREKRVCDPCVGTGRMPLHASNHSMSLYGCDIDKTMCQCTLVNLYIYAPWGAKPLPFLDKEQYLPELSAAISDSMVAVAPPHIAEKLAETEHDSDEQWLFEPIKKRRSKSTAEPEAKQGLLF